MRVLVWGLGYVGTVTAACLAQAGHEVTGIEPNMTKVLALNAGQSVIKEPGLSDMIKCMVRSGRLRATHDCASLVSRADLSLICVGTPSATDGRLRLDYIRNVAVTIGRGLRQTQAYHVVVLRSTVFPGTTRNVLCPLLEQHSHRHAGRDFGLVSNPEFLRETTAVSDFYTPSYTLLGALDDRSGETVAALYQTIKAPLYQVALEEAELCKMVTNAFHALKVGFANEIGRLCDRLDVDSHTIMQLLCVDTKLNISPAYLQPGFAFGGSCLPKDLRALVSHARCLRANLPIIDAILPSNGLQIDAARRKIHQLNVQRVGVLGLSFKPGTDDLRESPVIDLIHALWQDGINVYVYDPDVRIEDILGENRTYLERRLPCIRQMLRPQITDVLHASQVVVITQKRHEFTQAIQTMTNDQMTIFDLVRLDHESTLPRAAHYYGMSW